MKKITSKFKDMMTKVKQKPECKTPNAS